MVQFSWQSWHGFLVVSVRRKERWWAEEHPWCWTGRHQVFSRLHQAHCHIWTADVPEPVEATLHFKCIRPIEHELIQFKDGKTESQINTLWPGDAILHQRSGSAMACCLVAPRFYVNHCWLVISQVQWNLSMANFRINTSPMNHQHWIMCPRGLIYGTRVKVASELVMLSDLFLNKFEPIEKSV